MRGYKKNNRKTIEDIIATLEIKIDSYGEQGLMRAFILNNKILSDVEKDYNIKKMDKELDNFNLIYDVLCTIELNFNNNTLVRKLKKDRGWRSELDIPLNVFNNSIDEMISILEWFKLNSKIEKHKAYNKEIKLLIDLRGYRNK